MLKKVVCNHKFSHLIHPLRLVGTTTTTSEHEEILNNPDTDQINSKSITWNQFNERPLNIEPNQTSIILFPGQGSQFIGMGKDLIYLPKVKQMFEAANEMLRTNLLRLCLEGPMSRLSKTIHSQPAIFITSLAALVKLQEEDNRLVRNCVAVAGFSLGEITALVFSGAMTFEQGLHLVRVRAEAMQRACDETPGAMLTVFTTRETKLKLAMSAAKDYCMKSFKIETPCCTVSSHLYPHCKVIAGHEQAINFIEEHAVQFGFRRVKRLPVSGAFHTPLMNSAYRIFANSLSRIEDFKVPDIPVLSTLDVTLYRNSLDIHRLLPLQLVRPVRWEQTMYALYKRPPDADYPNTVEPGPGKQLGAMLKMCCPKAYNQYRSIDV